MSKKVTIVYYTSDLIPDLYFSSAEDADNFDAELDRYVNSPDSRVEFKLAMSHYASDASVLYHIDDEHDFIYNFTGPNSDRLVELTENAVEVGGDFAGNGGDLYQPVFKYLFNKIK
jgi:hypothetical protein